MPFREKGVPSAQQIEDMTNDFNPYYHGRGDTVDHMDHDYYVEMVKQVIASVAHLAIPAASLPPSPVPTITDVPRITDVPTMPPSPTVPQPTITDVPTNPPSPTIPLPTTTPSPTHLAPTMPPPVTVPPTTTPTTPPVTPASPQPTTPAPVSTTPAPFEQPVLLPFVLSGTS